MQAVHPLPCLVPYLLAAQAHFASSLSQDLSDYWYSPDPGRRYAVAVSTIDLNSGRGILSLLDPQALADNS